MTRQTWKFQRSMDLLKYLTATVLSKHCSIGKSPVLTLTLVIRREAVSEEKELISGKNSGSLLANSSHLCSLFYFWTTSFNSICGQLEKRNSIVALFHSNQTNWSYYIFRNTLKHVQKYFKSYPYHFEPSIYI